jgi:protein TonB
VRIGGQLEAPELVYRVEPVYPPIAVLSNAAGLVILEAIVDEKGLVTSVRVVRSHSLLDAAAVEAVRQWRYRPLLVGGTARSFVLNVVLTFSIERS